MATRLKLIGMGCLLVIALFFAFALRHAWQWLVCLALAFSWMGDALLARFDPISRHVPDPFIAGMGAFALAQIAYTIAFWRSMVAMPQLHMRVPGLRFGLEVLPAILPVYVLFGLLFWIWTVMRADKPWDLKIATLVYCILLSTMAGFAASAAFVGNGFVWPLMAGGTLFLVSDAIIAAHLFRGSIHDEKRYDFAVWATYLPAQILLMLGTSSLY